MNLPSPPKKLHLKNTTVVSPKNCFGEIGFLGNWVKVLNFMFYSPVASSPGFFLGQNFFVPELLKQEIAHCCCLGIILSTSPFTVGSSATLYQRQPEMTSNCNYQSADCNSSFTRLQLGNCINLKSFVRYMWCPIGISWNKTDSNLAGWRCSFEEYAYRIPNPICNLSTPR